MTQENTWFLNLFLIATFYYGTQCSANLVIGAFTEMQSIVAGPMGNSWTNSLRELSIATSLLSGSTGH